jgi:hypothetical protein
LITARVSAALAIKSPLSPEGHFIIRCDMQAHSFNTAECTDSAIQGLALSMELLVDRAICFQCL